MMRHHQESLYISPYFSWQVNPWFFLYLLFYSNVCFIIILDRLTNAKIKFLFFGRHYKGKGISDSEWAQIPNLLDNTQMLFFIELHLYTRIISNICYDFPRENPYSCFYLECFFLNKPSVVHWIAICWSLVINKLLFYRFKCLL